MRKSILFSLVFCSLFVVALVLSGEISFTHDPVVSASSPTEFTKYIDIVTEKTNWSSRTAYVVVAGSMSGNGKGQGTLTNVSILNEGPLPTYQDAADFVGTVYTSGRYEPGARKMSGLP